MKPGRVYIYTHTHARTVCPRLAAQSNKSIRQILMSLLRALLVRADSATGQCCYTLTDNYHRASTDKKGGYNHSYTIADV